MDLADYVRKQAEQILELARKTADLELREELTAIARTCLAELNKLGKKPERSDSTEPRASVELRRVMT
jgi:hypothetical protein